jgi:hypothetical protein
LASIVGRLGDLQAIFIKGSNLDWIELSQAWGANWVADYIGCNRQAFSFCIYTKAVRNLYKHDIIDRSWTYGWIYEGFQF